MGTNAIAFAADVRDRGVMQQAIDDGSGHHLVGEAPITGQDNRPPSRSDDLPPGRSSWQRPDSVENSPVHRSQGATD